MDTGEGPTGNGNGNGPPNNTHHTTADQQRERLNAPGREPDRAGKAQLAGR